MAGDCELCQTPALDRGHADRLSRPAALRHLRIRQQFTPSYDAGQIVYVRNVVYLGMLRRPCHNTMSSNMVGSLREGSALKVRLAEGTFLSTGGSHLFGRKSQIAW